IGPSYNCLENFFLRLSSSSPRPELLTDNLGASYEILNNYFKTYPACAHVHSSVEAMEYILTNHQIQIADIGCVEVRTYPLAARLNDQNPLNTLAGMFSIPYCLGTMLVKGTLTVEPLVAEAPLEPQVLRMASLIRVVKDENLKPHYPTGRPSLVRIHLKNGAEYEHFVDIPRGDENKRISDKVLEEKFLEMVNPITGIKRAQELKRNIDDLEKVTDISELLIHLYS
ncbi:MAG: hypothetical protein ACFFCW_31415, partial [Candidatus Hodarchaeota archaeon]